MKIASHTELLAENTRLQDKIVDMEQVISELISQLKIAQERNRNDQEEKPISILDIDLFVNARAFKEAMLIKGIPCAGANCKVHQSLIDELYAWELWSYKDESEDLREHLFGLSLFDDFQEKGVYLNTEKTKALQAIYKEMEEKDCSYFRFIS